MTTTSRALVLFTDLTDLSPEPARRLLDEHGADAEVLVRDASGAVAESQRAAVGLIAGYSRIDAELLAQLPELSIIAASSNGTDMIDLDAAAARGIWVTNVAHAATEEVAVHTLALALSLVRHMPAMTRTVARGEWTDELEVLPRRASSLTLGLIGYGQIGAEVARIAAPVFARIVASDPEAPPSDGNAESVDLAEVLAASDIVSLHVPLTPETRAMLGSAEIAQMRPGAILLNTSRGEVVDLDAVRAALDDGHLGAVGLDVLVGEPPAADHPLRTHPRALLTPHAAFLSDESIIGYETEPARCIADWLTTGAPSACIVVDPTGVGAVPVTEPVSDRDSAGTSAAVSVDPDDEVIAALATGEPTSWFRSDLPATAEVLAEIAIDPSVMDAAAARLERFAPWFAAAFPETADAGGIIESPLQAAPAAQRDLEARLGAGLPGSLWLKRDDALPVSGSIKARGGFHEVVEHAEAVAADHGLDAADPATYSSDAFREKAAAHRIVVGSTGNLGLSIGILSAVLGFATSVHMSADAREWKKEKLRGYGVDVVEHAGDFVAAVEAGRASAARTPRTHFVDDEDSISLFAGYSVAALRLARQFAEAGERVDADNPLVVYLPCGIGGGPGGVTYGLKRVFGDAVHCVFVEPTQAPAMFLGVRSGLHSETAVQDIGLSGATAADGLAVARPSRFIGPTIGPLISGFTSVSDDVIKAGVGVLHAAEGIDVEPSATAGLTIPWRAVAGAGVAGAGAAGGAPWPPTSATKHLVWLTGGAMVPADEMEHYLVEGAALLGAIG